MNKFKKVLFEQVINELDFSYIKKVLGSKLRGALRLIGFIPPTSQLLDKYEELGNLYTELIFGEADPIDVEIRFKAFINEHPEFKKELRSQIDNNIFDLDPAYIVQSLQLLSEIGDIDVPGEKAKVDAVLADYEKSGNDVKVLRQGVQKLVDDEFAQLDKADAEKTVDVKAEAEPKEEPKKLEPAEKIDA